METEILKLHQNIKAVKMAALLSLITIETFMSTISITTNGIVQKIFILFIL